jgi:hypothetical protein
VLNDDKGNDGDERDDYEMMTRKRRRSLQWDLCRVFERFGL